MQDSNYTNGPEADGISNTNYETKYDLTAKQMQALKDKFKKDKDFVQPSNDCEREYAVDQIIQQLVEVKKEQWGKPVKLDQKAIKFLIDESTKVLLKDPMLLDLEAPIKVFGDTHG